MDERLAWALVIGTIPGAIVGATFQNVIEEKLGDPALIAVMLAVFGVVLYVVDERAPVRTSFSDITVRNGGILGVAQAVALQPGVSRSGVTITAARLMGIDRESEARFSFLLSIPIIASAGLFKASTSCRTASPGHGTGVLLGDRLIGGKRIPGDRLPARLPPALHLLHLHGLPARGGSARAGAFATGARS